MVKVGAVREAGVARLSAHAGGKQRDTTWNQEDNTWEARLGEVGTGRCGAGEVGTGKWAGKLGW